MHLRLGDPALRAGDYVRVNASDPHVAAWLRSFGEEHVLVLDNFGDQPLAGVALDLDAGRLCQTSAMTTLYATGGIRGPALAPTVTAAGGLSGYVPFATLPARSSVVLRFQQ